MAEEAQHVHYRTFFIDEDPFCLWDLDLAKRNREFLDGIDPVYYRHMADVHGRDLTDENRQHSALALRLTYSQALETFLALLCAAIQAPTCPLGWMVRYQNHQLDRAVEKLLSGQRLPSRGTEPTDWLSLSCRIHRWQLDDAELCARMHEWFATAWARFAADYALSSYAKDEYNSIKHGLRTRYSGGGFDARIDPVDGSNELAALNVPGFGRPTLSEYGSHFFVKESIGKTAVNFKVVYTARNWDPKNLTAALRLLSVSVNNVVSYLKLRAGASGEDAKFMTSTIEEDFTSPWAVNMGLAEVQQTNPLEAEHIQPFTKREIRMMYGLDTTQSAPHN